MNSRFVFARLALERLLFIEAILIEHGKSVDFKKARFFRRGLDQLVAYPGDG